VIDGGGHAAADDSGIVLARVAAILAADGRGWTPIVKCFWGRRALLGEIGVGLVGRAGRVIDGGHAAADGRR